MKVTADAAELRRIRGGYDGSCGLVPTMGALHAGHLSLVARAREQCERVGVSIFVNPTQFGPGEDLAVYPRSIAHDLDLLAQAGADFVWTPVAADVYPPGFQTWVTVEEVSAPLEGRSRPGHFRGVATMVVKLLNVFTPDRAYFGQKDAQQVAVILRMVQDLAFQVELVVCPTVREPDGLAMSSRNAYLSPVERRAATVLYRALTTARAMYEQGERNPAELRRVMQSVVSDEPLASPDYASVADPATLAELYEVHGRVLLLLAVRIGTTRLIDNLLL
jgi:pantoate--beta-alanine ligase